MSDRDTTTFATTAADVPAPEPQLREQASPIAASTVELHVGNLQCEPLTLLNMGCFTAYTFLALPSLFETVSQTCPRDGKIGQL